MRDVLEDDVVSHDPYSPAHRDDYFHEERLICLIFDGLGKRTVKKKVKIFLGT